MTLTLPWPWAWITYGCIALITLMISTVATYKEEQFGVKGVFFFVFMNISIGIFWPFVVCMYLEDKLRNPLRNRKYLR